jgi:diketogulonate reductase-like aldo/keto reductase
MDTSTRVREVLLPSGEDLPAIGLGTWRMGESSARAAADESAIRGALEIGYRVIDTAEMYGAGGAETLVGKALRGAIRSGLSREEVFVVSKALPAHSDTAGLVAACEASLGRLHLDRIDLYLLHWRGGVPLKDTVDGFEILQRRGLIRHWGVSNFDLADMRALFEAPGGSACSVNQVWYSLSQRGVEFDLLPWQRVHQMPLMAYCPIDQGELLRQPELAALAEEAGCTPAQMALAWLTQQPGVMAIPKAANPVHLKQNWEASRSSLSSRHLARLDEIFARPQHKSALAMR